MKKKKKRAKYKYSSYGRRRKRLICWLREHDAHGLSYDGPFWFEENDPPPYNADDSQYIRAPWLDEPK
jgi:hypothetical protein